MEHKGKNTEKRIVPVCGSTALCAATTVVCYPATQCGKRQKNDTRHVLRGAERMLENSE